jgi:hypothetical protein
MRQVVAIVVGFSLFYIFTIFFRGGLECGWTWRLGSMFDCGMGLITKD